MYITAELEKIIPGAKSDREHCPKALILPSGETVRGTTVEIETVPYDTSYHGMATFLIRQWSLPSKGITVAYVYHAWGGGLEHSEGVWSYMPYVIS